VTRIDAPIESGIAVSRDGTRLRYHVLGRGPGRWLLPTAMGAPLVALKYLFEAFRDAYTMVTWDMRGFHGSAPPADPSALAVQDHIHDLVAVRDATGRRRRSTR
jgi:pimeloyl-ACP methyl ester carboxylesterase